jgi:hypothetical protein
MYKYEINGIIYVSANVPEGATIVETMDILNADDGYELVRKSNGEKLGANVWLKDGDTQDNYNEIPEPQEDDEQSPID